MKKILAFCIICLLAGCNIYKKNYDYRVVIKNTGEFELEDVSITSQKGLLHETGYVVKGAHAGLGAPQSTPPNDIYTIILKREDGFTEKHIVDLRDKVEKGFKGWLIFTINDRNEIGYLLEDK